MTPNEYQQLALRSQADQHVILNRLFFGPGYGEKAMQLDCAARGLADDAGEVNGCVKKFIEYGQPLDVVNLKEEVGDCLWRLAQVCDSAGFTLEDAMVANLQKLKLRYPDGYSDFQAAEENRNRGAEREVVEQTGSGFAEPPEELVVTEVLPVLTAHFGDGFVREPRDSSYSGFCDGCNKSIHRTNTAGFCPDCFAVKARAVGNR